MAVCVEFKNCANSDFYFRFHSMVYSFSPVASSCKSPFFRNRKSDDHIDHHLNHLYFLMFTHAKLHFHSTFSLAP